MKEASHWLVSVEVIVIKLPPVPVTTNESAGPAKVNVVPVANLTVLVPVIPVTLKL